MIVKILTTDEAWSARHALSVVVENGNPFAHVEIDGDSVERLTFGPKNAQMIRFNLSQVAKKLPRDCWNANVMIPAMHIVEG